MAHAPNSTRPRILENDQVRFALVLATLALALIALVALFQRQHPARLPIAHQRRAVQQRLSARHLTRTSEALARACPQDDCACATQAIRAALDVDAAAEALALLDVAAACPNPPSRRGLRSEALVRSGALEKGMELTNEVLVPKRRDPYALLAQALAAYRLGATDDSLAIAAEALRAGRGFNANFLRGAVYFARGELVPAKAEFSAVLAAEPDDVDALFDSALVADRQHRYGEARSAYLRVLALDPRRKEARHHLGVMAHGIGAENEARHHLEKLELMAPGDPLVADLRSVLATPAHPPGQVLTLGAPSP